MAPKTTQDSKAVAVGEEQPKAVALVNRDDEGAGFEDMTQDELAMPFLIILQSGSPQVLEDSGKYVAGAKPGMFFNTVTQELYDGREKGVRFIPVHRAQQFIEWRKRDEGGGLVAVHAPEDPFVIEARKTGPRFGKIDLASKKGHEDNELAETFNVPGMLLVDDEQVEPCVLSFTSTAIKHYKRWMTQASSIMGRDAENKRARVPLFGHVYLLKTGMEENNDGQKWYGWRIGFASGTADASRLGQDHELYRQAKQLREAVMSGTARAATESLTQSEGNAGDAPDAPTPAKPGSF